MNRANFNLQVLACFCFALATCLRTARHSPTSSRVSIPARWSGAGLLCILLLTCAAYLPSLHDSLLSDDYILIHVRANPAHLLTTFIRPAGDGAMRPVGELVFGLWKFWAQEDPVKWHVLGLTLHLINTLLLYWFCTRLHLPTYASLIACVLFALHPAHPEAVAWASSTFDLLAALFSLLSLIVLTFESTAAIFIAAPVLTALAILSKESAHVLPAVAFLVLANRRRTIYPSVLVAALLFVHRWQVFSGPGGYVDPTTGHSQILSVTTMSALKALLYRPWWVFLTPIDWAVAPRLALIALLCLMFVSLSVLAVRSQAARRVHLLWMSVIAVTLIPPIHLALIGSDLQGTRVFYLPSVFFCIWFSQIPRHWAFAGVAALFSFFALRHNLAIRSEVAVAANAACQAGANGVRQSGGKIVVEGLPRSLDGVFFFANGFEECVRAASGDPLAITLSTRQDNNTPVLRWAKTLRRLQPAK